MGQDELVEVVARAMYFDHVDQHGYPNGLMTWDELPDHIERRIDINTRDHWRSIARAIIPIVLEQAAKVAESPGFIECRDTEWDAGVNDAKRSIAQAIRSLLPVEEEGG